MIPQDILESNRDLTPGERHDVKQLAQDTDSKLKEVKQALSKLKQEEKRLKKEGKKLKKTAKNCQLALAPIRMLPRDVIGEIFLACEPWESFMSPKEAPVLLTHICSAFRDIALSMPVLWAAFIFDIPKVRGEGEVRGEDKDKDENRIAQARSYLWSRVDAIETWIHRSGTVPLSIECWSGMEYDMLQNFKEEENALAEVLLKGASRWCELSLRCDQHSPLFVRIMELTPDKVPLLTAFSLYYRDKKCFLPGNLFLAPNLTELSLEGYLDASKNQVNWSQFRQLTLNLCLWGSTAEIQILRQTKNLVKLSLDDRMINNDIDDIYLPHLRELTVGTADVLPSSDLLVGARIHAPGLETLCVDSGPVVRYTNLVKRSPRLCNLEIRNYYSNSDGAWLRNCPQVTSLVIVHWNQGLGRGNHKTGLLEELVLDHDGTYTCPNLRIFKYDGILAVPFDILCQFLGTKLGISDTPLLRTWEHISLKVFITDWESKNENDEALNEIVKGWTNAGVLQLEITN